MTDPSLPAADQGAPSPATPTQPASPAGDDVLVSGGPDEIQEAIRASQQRLSEAVDDLATAVNPVHVAHRSADAVREDPRPALAVAGAVVVLGILLTVIRRARRGRRAGAG
jgi:hypothetical protein